MLRIWPKLCDTSQPQGHFRGIGWRVSSTHSTGTWLARSQRLQIWCLRTKCSQFPVIFPMNIYENGDFGVSHGCGAPKLLDLLGSWKRPTPCVHTTPMISELLEKMQEDSAFENKNRHTFFKDTIIYIYIPLLPWGKLWFSQRRCGKSADCFPFHIGISCFMMLSGRARPCRTATPSWRRFWRRKTHPGSHWIGWQEPMVLVRSPIPTVSAIPPN